MKIKSIHIQNFRKLLNCQIDFSEEVTLFVGANNSGKTSAMDALGKFLARRTFVFNDITVSNRKAINKMGEEWISEESREPEDVVAWEKTMPQMDIWLDVPSHQIYYVANIIPTLNWRGGTLGVRLAFFPKDIAKLFTNYREAYFAARTTESSKPDKSIVNSLYPKRLCDFMEKELTSYFSIKAYILDPEKEDDDEPQATSYDMACLTDNPLMGLIKIDMISAQRGYTDPDTVDSEKIGTQLSTKMRKYYDKHLDPEKIPAPEDLELLEAAEEARGIFDKSLREKFTPAIEELENLGYPGISNPKVELTTKVNASETLSHDSAVKYLLSDSDKDLSLPEKYNGLGYQNLISIVFDLMSFRDGWMRTGKATKVRDKLSIHIEPLHLVLIEEPEAHLHVQVQQVFIRQAYSVLRNHSKLKAKNESEGDKDFIETEFSTQLAISTHSSHIARETKFVSMRYFKRMPESQDCSVSTAKVVNLSDVFGKEDETDKFVTRYLQANHCDLFFADAAILVEGSAESMLLPHFIRSKYKELYQRYISLLSISGKHSHRLRNLIEKLCLPTLVVADLDSAENTGHHKAVVPERGKNLISGNYTIANWLMKESSLDILLNKKISEKEFQLETPYKFSIRVAYQTPIILETEQESIEALSSTFEDCLIYTNYETFKKAEVKETGSFVKKIHDIINDDNSFDVIHEKIYKALRDGKSNQKAEFALDIIYEINPSDIIVPSYISEGLEWLQQLLHREE